NRAAQEITELGYDDVYMKSIRDIFPSLSFPEVAARSDSTQVSPRYETTFVRRDGKEVYLGFSVSVLKDREGSEMGTILTFQDLTALKEMQEYVQRTDRLAAVGRLAAGIAHEIRNPLASISGSIQVLKKGLELTGPDGRLMDIIIRESNNLSLLISDFTQFARPVQKEREKIKVKFLIDDVIGLFENSPECSHVGNVVAEVQDSIFIHANYQQMKQVLWNLMINAAQAVNNSESAITINARMHEGGLPPAVPEQPGITERRDRPSGEWIIMEVADSGGGIEQEAIDKIFDPF
ncbi:MAG: PAS domain S-box protein, partial [Deltaproteobacteria bacterium]|nr:PAS domain S-box protein [Deltaproteobacteria bacterium]